MSKLAALAAKRRQKEAAASQTSQTIAEPLADEYAASLSKLSLGNDRLRERKQSASAIEKESAAGPSTEAEQQGIPADTEQAIPEEEIVVMRTNPSAFAGAFLNSTQVASDFAIDPTDLVQKTAFTFNDPSPDDIVFKAQTGRSR